MRPVKNQELIDQLPFPYGDDYIFIMVKDPKCLFTYWEISNAKLEDFKKAFGADAVEKTHPMLRIVNLSKNKENFIRINEFSTDWYINVADAGGMYCAEIGRQFGDGFFVCFSRSNILQTPFEKPSGNHALLFTNYKDMKADFDETVSGIEGNLPHEMYASGSEMMFGKKCKELK